jgi:hypothetical protein
LLEFNLQIACLPGKSNVFADGLSRVRLRVTAALARYGDWLARISKAVEQCPIAAGLKRTVLNRPLYPGGIPAKNGKTPKNPASE